MNLSVSLFFIIWFASRQNLIINHENRDGKERGKENFLICINYCVKIANGMQTQWKKQKKIGIVFHFECVHFWCTGNLWFKNSIIEFFMLSHSIIQKGVVYSTARIHSNYLRITSETSAGMLTQWNLYDQSERNKIWTLNSNRFLSFSMQTIKYQMNSLIWN